MIINDLSKELGIENKELITFLKSKGYKVSSHRQNASNAMIEAATKNFEKKKEEPKQEVKEEKKVEPKATTPTASKKVFSPEDMIPCRSVTPWKLMALGVDRVTVYNWNFFGDVDYVRYKDLQALRRKDIVTKPKIIIEDPDLCEQWKREIGEIYKPFLGVEYPEELFDLSDDEFKKLLETSNDTVREVIKVTAVNMVKNENYPTVQKLNIIDETLGTCIKEFL